MSKLQFVDTKTMEKLLFKIGFEKIRRKAAMYQYPQKNPIHHR
jgi:predicted RNA binding protein YcfA (HicA-like mRNA interferase family)